MALRACLFSLARGKRACVVDVRIVVLLMAFPQQQLLLNTDYCSAYISGKIHYPIKDWCNIN